MKEHIKQNPFFLRVYDTRISSDISKVASLNLEGKKLTVSTVLCFLIPNCIVQLLPAPNLPQ